jgi:glycerophosphoryl diester phosphodiesterase
MKEHKWSLLKEALFYLVLDSLIIIGIILMTLMTSLLLVGLFGGFGEKIVLSLLIAFGLLVLVITTSYFESFHILHMTKLFNDMVPTEPLALSSIKKDRLLDRIFRNKILIVGLLVVSVFIISVAVFLLEEIISLEMYDIEITAHRGSSVEAPENTLSAIELAIANGADYVEIDVQQTSDGHLILLHDYTLLRTTGFDEHISNITLDQIQTLEAGSFHSKKFEGEPIPTLAQVFKSTKGRIKYNIELKISGHEKDYLEELIGLINEYDVLSDCVITSSNYELLQALEALEPKLNTGYIMFIASGNLEKLNVDFYSVEQQVASSNFVAEAHKLGRQVHVWTINETEDILDLLLIGVDNIITDYDRSFKETLKTIKEIDSWLK